MQAQKIRPQTIRRATSAATPDQVHRTRISLGLLGDAGRPAEAQVALHVVRRTAGRAPRRARRTAARSGCRGPTSRRTRTAPSHRTRIDARSVLTGPSAARAGVAPASSGGHRRLASCDVPVISTPPPGCRCTRWPRRRWPPRSPTAGPTRRGATRRRGGPDCCSTRPASRWPRASARGRRRSASPPNGTQALHAAVLGTLAGDRRRPTRSCTAPSSTRPCCTRPSGTSPAAARR